MAWIAWALLVFGAWMTTPSAAMSSPAAVSIEGFDFLPGSVTVAPGTTVTWALLVFEAWMTTPSAAMSSPVAVSIEGFDFLPGSVTVAPGTTVTWTHNDGLVGHNVSLPGYFRSPGMYEGGTFSFSFELPGTYRYGCSLHPTLMVGEVVVRAATEPEPARPAASLAPPRLAPAGEGATFNPPGSESSSPPVTPTTSFRPTEAAATEVGDLPSPRAIREVAPADAAGAVSTSGRRFPPAASVTLVAVAAAAALWALRSRR